MRRWNARSHSRYLFQFLRTSDGCTKNSHLTPLYWNPFKTTRNDFFQLFQIIFIHSERIILWENFKTNLSWKKRPKIDNVNSKKILFIQQNRLVFLSSEPNIYLIWITKCFLRGHTHLSVKKRRKSQSFFLTKRIKILTIFIGCLEYLLKKLPHNF